MLKAEGCTFGFIKGVGEKTWTPRSTEHFEEPGGRCNDCGALHGKTHHYGCDVERCPKCGGQMIGCECWGEKFELSTDGK
jgi:hypothetical protein